MSVLALISISERNKRMSILISKFELASVIIAISQSSRVLGPIASILMHLLTVRRGTIIHVVPPDYP